MILDVADRSLARGAAGEIAARSGIDVCGYYASVPATQRLVAPPAVAHAAGWRDGFFFQEYAKQ